MPPRANRPIAVPRQGGLVVVGHESPHRFDQFSLDHLGTGEGAQAYSKGLYFWENPKVGENYRDQFQYHPAVSDNEDYQRWKKASGEQERWDRRKFDNERLYSGPFMSFLQEYEYGLRGAELPAYTSGARETYAEAFNRIFSDEQRAELARLRHAIPAAPASARSFDPPYGRKYFAEQSTPYYEAVYDFLSPELRREIGNNTWGKKYGDATREEWAKWAAKEFPFDSVELGPRPPDPGPEPMHGPFTYHVNLHADRSDFPDLNTLLYYQPSHLRDALLDFAAERAPELSTHDRKALSLNNLRSSSWRPKEDRPHPSLGSFESGLANRGIPGVRYDDYTRNTRAPDEGRTQNFVVYDPSIIELVKRYPYAVLLPMLMSQGQAQEQSPVPSLLAGTLLE